MIHATIVSLFMLLSFWSASIAQAEITPQRQQQLIHLLRHDCGSCHGMSLKGGLGPPLTPEVLAGKSPELLEETIYRGLAERAMPPWHSLLSREEVHWIVEHIKKGDLP